MPVTEPQPFVTTSLDVAAFLTAIGRQLIRTQPQGRFLAFQFDSSASTDAEKYFAGASVPAKAVLEAYRELRNLIVTTERAQKKAYVLSSSFSQ